MCHQQEAAREQACHEQHGPAASSPSRGFEVLATWTRQGASTDPRGEDVAGPPAGYLPCALEGLRTYTAWENVFEDLGLLSVTVSIYVCRGVACPRGRIGPP